MSKKRFIQSCNSKVIDELISGFRPQTRSKGNLPHLAHNLWKPEDLGTEFKCVACTILRITIATETCQSKDDSNGKQLIAEYKSRPQHAAYGC